MDDRTEREHKEAAVHTNRLARETSPYLLQHAHNPVDWYPWGEEAFAKARNEDRPILLSIGYSACHWCHVMERESFENQEIASLLNREFVPIKVDREERPDLDEVYMTAVQLLTGSGGWPLNVFLTPELEPFHGGTYYPPEDRWGRPGFGTLLARIAQVWKEQRGDVETHSRGLSKHVAEVMAAMPDTAGLPDLAAVDQAVGVEIAQAHDPQWGGFSPAPKFPAVGRLRHLLRLASAGPCETAIAREAALHTLRMMAFGGIYDHLGGGFHRYSVDDRWLVPHFEKMLYDNAQLALVYIEAFQLSGDPLFRRVAGQTLDYLLRDMRNPDGTFYAAEDADSGGAEGLFYTWTQTELRETLGPEDARWLEACYGVTAAGNFEGRSILFLPEGLPDQVVRLDQLRDRLLAVRAERERPLRDEKVITCWNGLALRAFALVGFVLDEPRYLDAARALGRFYHSELETGQLMRIHKGSQAHIPGYLQDYACLANGLIELYQATGECEWLALALRAADTMVESYYDRDARAFAASGPANETLLATTYPLTDGVVPPGGAVAVEVLLRLHALTGRESLVTLAREALDRGGLGDPRRATHMTALLGAAAFLPGRTTEVVIAGPEAPGGDELLQVLRTGYFPATLIVQLPAPACAAAAVLAPELVQGRTPLDGNATAYVCRSFACRRPVTSPVELARGVAGL